MLVLSRKTEESFLIGDDIVISIVRVRGNKVRIGIQAPPSVPVTRTELLATDYVRSVVDATTFRENRDLNEKEAALVRPR